MLLNEQGVSTIVVQQAFGNPDNEGNIATHMGLDIMGGYLASAGDHGAEVSRRGKADETCFASRIDDNDLAPSLSAFEQYFDKAWMGGGGLSTKHENGFVSVKVGIADGRSAGAHGGAQSDP